MKHNCIRRLALYCLMVVYRNEHKSRHLTLEHISSKIDSIVNLLELALRLFRAVFYVTVFKEVDHLRSIVN